MYHLLYVMAKQRRCRGYGNQEIADIGRYFMNTLLYPILGAIWRQKYRYSKTKAPAFPA